MEDLDIMAFRVFGGEGMTCTYINDFADNLDGLRFPLLVGRISILYFKTWNDAAMGTP